MYENFDKQVGVENTGAVEAAPDHNTDAGSYYFDWMRDGSLTMLTYMQLNDSDLKKIS